MSKEIRNLIRRILREENSRRTNIGRDSFSFDETYDKLLGSTYFKFKNYEIWFNVDGKEITDDITNKILDSFTPQESYNSFKEWKNSEWYNTTGFPFSNKDWTTVKSSEGDEFKWRSTGHKQMEKQIFDSYLEKYGKFMVVDLT